MLRNAIDSDDIQVIASLIESNLSKEQIDKLQKMLKIALQKNEFPSYEACSISQLLNFID